MSCQVVHPTPVGSAAKSRVKRSLFGPVDHAVVRSELARQLCELKIVDKQRWNFDFDDECPAAGRYLWEKVFRGCQLIPGAYEMPHLDEYTTRTSTPVRMTFARVVSSGRKPQRHLLSPPSGSTLSEDSCDSGVSSPGSPDCDTSVLVQAKVSDFFCAKRKRSSAMSPMSTAKRLRLDTSDSRPHHSVC